MVRSRLARVEERRERNRIVYATFGIITLVVFLALFGLKILVGFSLLVDRIRGGSPQASQSESILVPPVLNPPPETTNTNDLTISGSGQTGMTLVLYVNGAEAKKLTIEESGIFSIPIKLSDGSNSISAKTIDEEGNTSALSEVYTINVKKSAPVLEVTQPSDGDKIQSEKNIVLVAGRAEEGTKVTINGRLAILGSDGSFRMNIQLSEGDNTITVIATDLAGNQTLVERKVNYQK